MIHTLYKTTNLINGRDYYGVHSTQNIQDQYLGSGTIICQAIKKYGRKNFVKKILMTFPTRKDALEHEKFLVTQDFIKRYNAYNIVDGGGDPPSHKGKAKSEKWKALMSKKMTGKRNPGATAWNLNHKREQMTGRIVVNNGLEEKCVYPNNIPMGFIKGALKRGFRRII